MSEDENSVTYKVESNIYEDSPAKVKRIVKALCLFDKNLETIVFDIENTDTYYFDSRWEQIYILGHLKKLNKNGEVFPDMYDIATGG